MAMHSPHCQYTDAAENSCCCAGESASERSPAHDVNEPAGVEIATYRIEGLGCSYEGQIVENQVKSLRGIIAFGLNPITSKMMVSYDPSLVSVHDIEDAVKKAGATAVPLKSR